jgi:serine/threonine-protein kinase
MAETESSSSMTAMNDDVIARQVVEQGLATAQEVQTCQRKLAELLTKADSRATSLSQVLVAAGIVTQRQLDRLQADRPETDDLQIPGFEILGELGAGAMARVYKARQVSLDRIVAVKILPQRHTKNPQFVERFYAEGKAAAKLNHPNIVQAIDVGQAGKHHYFVMEYVEGRTVFDDLTALGRYEERAALDIAIQIAKALNHAHHQGFIHRDVKPKNIMLTSSGVAKLADMGLARAVSDREAAEAEKGKAFGTPYYISPEQIRGELDVDFRADIYGFGATLYQMVTGKVPFEGPNPTAVMHAHLKNTLVPPDHMNQSLSAGLSEIVEVCLAKNRNERYNTTDDLVADLEAVSRGEPPVQARKRFDLSSLTNLEGDASGLQVVNHPDSLLSPPLMKQPVFWVAVAGWILAAAMAIVAINQT